MNNTLTQIGAQHSFLSKYDSVFPFFSDNDIYFFSYNALAI